MAYMVATLLLIASTLIIPANWLTAILLVIAGTAWIAKGVRGIADGE